MDILRAKTQQLLVLEDGTEDESLAQKLDEVREQIIQELEGKKVEQAVFAKLISSEKSEYEEIKQNLIRTNFELNRHRQLRYSIPSESPRHKELLRWRRIIQPKLQPQLECHYQQQQHLHPSSTAEICQTSNNRIKTLQYQLRHKRRNNVSEERAILREISQLDEIAKGKGKEKDSDEFYNLSMKQIHRRIKGHVEYYEYEAERLRQQELSKRYRISKLEEDKNDVEKRIKFLERRLARTYSTGIEQLLAL